MINDGGVLTLGLDYRSASRHPVFGNDNGRQWYVQHMQKNLFGGFNKIALQFGSGIAANLSSLADESKPVAEKSARLVEQLLLEPGKNWSALLALVYERQRNVQTWTSIGLRPIYYLNEHFNVAVELGHDRVAPDSGEALRLNKITLATQYSKARGFWSRPLVRAFITYASWNRAALDAGLANGSAGVFAGQTQGLNYGLQLEHWW